MRGDIKPFEFMARREDWSNGISLYSRQVTEGVCVATATQLIYEDLKPGMMASPFAVLEIQSAQQLMDELWQCGLRPSEGTGSAGSLRATEKHLDDMRAIVAKKLGLTI